MAEWNGIAESGKGGKNVGGGLNEIWYMTAEPKPLLGHHLWPGLAWPKWARLGAASGFEPGQAKH